LSVGEYIMVARNLFQNHEYIDHAQKRGRQVVILKEKQRWCGKG